MDARARHALALYTNISSNCDRKLKATNGSGTMLGLISLGVIGKQLFGTRAIYKKNRSRQQLLLQPHPMEFL